MSRQLITFIGGGNMATALISGLLADGTPADSIIVAEPDSKKREALAARYGVRTREDNQGAAREADTLILSVKPQMLEAVAREISAVARQRQPLVISIAAGVRHSDLQDWLGTGVPLVRTMPNTPAMIQAGATALYADPGVPAELRNQAERIMRAVGLTQWVDNEDQIDAVTAVSGSGPAYFFLFMEAMENAATELGLSKDTAHLLVLQTALGAARMSMENKIELAVLRENVTSPGGTTEKALNRFEEGGLRGLVHDAMSAAKERSIELSELLSKK